MTSRVRTTVFIVGAVGLGVLCLWGITGLPDFGVSESIYSRVLQQVALEERKATNIVAAVTFDYRGYDTLMEEVILFSAVLATALMLRPKPDEEEEPPDDEAIGFESPDVSDAVRIFCLGLVGPSILLSLYVVAHGHLTPGGGFQGGVMLATAPLMIYLGGEFVAFRKLSPVTIVEPAEGIGAGGFVLVGTAGLWVAGSFLQNFLPLGDPGALLSAGMIPVVNLLVGLAVAAAFVLIAQEFLEQSLIVRVGGSDR
jgi:multicomponent Na+:H+ antiporter subunit B